MKWSNKNRVRWSAIGALLVLSAGTFFLSHHEGALRFVASELPQEAILAEMPEILLTQAEETLGPTLLAAELVRERIEPPGGGAIPVEELRGVFSSGFPQILASKGAYVLVEDDVVSVTYGVATKTQETLWEHTLSYPLEAPDQPEKQITVYRQSRQGSYNVQAIYKNQNNQAYEKIEVLEPWYYFLKR